MYQTRFLQLLSGDTKSVHSTCLFHFHSDAISNVDFLFWFMNKEAAGMNVFKNHTACVPVITNASSKLLRKKKIHYYVSLILWSSWSSVASNFSCLSNPIVTDIRPQSTWHEWESDRWRLDHLTEYLSPLYRTWELCRLGFHSANFIHIHIHDNYILIHQQLMSDMFDLTRSRYVHLKSELMNENLLICQAGAVDSSRWASGYSKKRGCHGLRFLF